MRVNALTTETGLKVGPVVLETLIRHYFERRKTRNTTTQLRQDELLYDEVFNVVKSFLRAASFANTRTPSPPSVHVVRLLVPMTSCDEAARILITAFGGKEAAQRIVGGVKWWQVRGINGVDAQWITAKKDWETAQRRTKMKEKTKDASSGSLPATDPMTETGNDSGIYEKHMDEMRCILYSHGDLYLIRPPPGAAHRPVNPAHIIIAGDSAGGGLSLALLQVIRDSGLPTPAGGDVLPEWGLSLQKPSVLWPPPPDELSKRVHASLRTRIREVFRPDQPYDPTATMLSMAQSTSAGQPVDVGTTTSLPISDSQHIDQNVSLVARSGDTLSTSNQLHLYTQNNLLTHPLVSPVMSYLGGLPPLLFIASDREVLRDEIIYTAHKAANPEKYPIQDSSRTLYPSLNRIEDRCEPTQVHLQYCFRAIATFCKYVTGIPMTPAPPPPTPDNNFPTNVGSHSSLSPNRGLDAREDSLVAMKSDTPRRKSLSRSLSSRFSRMMQSRSRLSRTSSEDGVLQKEPAPPLASGDDSFVLTSLAQSPDSSETSYLRRQEPPFQVTAGEPRVYRSSGNPWDGTMIRERISTQGIIRPLEPESELSALTIDPDIIGCMSELTLRRYLDARAMFDKKFAYTIRTIERDRKRNLQLAKRDIKRDLAALHHKLILSDAESGGPSSSMTSRGRREGSFASSGSWNWAWALDGEERPPPSSIVSRRDTAEARHLAKIADQFLFQDDQALSGNRFWSAVLNFFTSDQDQQPSDTNLTKRPSRLDRLFLRERSVKDISSRDGVTKE
ncbi:hypothetical protein C0992_000518 [Termitomyces sp. T32_za158]|nr:hypothetical protein C0992_000518 [Termitomyces sp. T32_za158]